MTPGSSSRIRLAGALAAAVLASLAAAQTTGAPTPETQSPNPPAASLPPSGHEPLESPAPAIDDTSAIASVEQAAIEAVLSRYRTAFNSLDAAAVAGIWPGVNVRTLSEAFGNLVEQQFFFRKCEVWLTGVLAVASCGGTARYVPKAGAKTPRLEPRTWTFKLSKDARGWLIYNVETRYGVSAVAKRS
jgi:hypothetical protein